MSVADMQEWILLLQKPVRDLENSKLLLLCKKTIPRMLNSSATQTAASGGSMQIRRKQEFYPSLSMLLNQKNPFLHCFSRQQIYIPGVFCSRAGAQGAAMLASRSLHISYRQKIIFLPIDIYRNLLSGMVSTLKTA